MNFLDENIPESQLQLLKSWRMKVRQIGREVGRPGMKDDEIIILLHGEKTPTFFTRDLGFYQQLLCHANYCLVSLSVGQYEVASFIRRFLKHSAFNTRAKRMGKVVSISHTELRFWNPHTQEEERLVW